MASRTIRARVARSSRRNGVSDVALELGAAGAGPGEAAALAGNIRPGGEAGEDCEVGSMGEDMWNAIVLRAGCATP
jgi:hypothetical protein